MHLVRREVARVARPELAALAVYLRERRALEQVAHLRDARMRMRQRALARLGHAEHHLGAFGPHGVRPGRGRVHGAGAGGRAVAREPRAPERETALGTVAS